jgi:cell division protein FtsL
MATAHKTGARSALGGLLHSPSLPVLLTFAAMAIGLAALVPIIQSSGATSRAGQISQLEEQRAGWQARIRELELDVAQQGSLDRIEREAKTRLKMEQPKESHYIAVPVPAPEQHRLPSRYLPPAPPHHDTSASLWHDLWGWLPLP